MDKNQLLNKLKIALTFVALIWGVFLVDFLSSGYLSQFGIRPRNLYGLVGIFTAPFLHAGLWHIVSNTFPLFLLSFALFVFYPKHAWRVIIFSIVLGGALVWIMGRNANHIGASGLIYALAAFLIAAGLYTKSVKGIIVSLIIIILYGGLIWGVFPTRPWVSWEGHLFGAVAGVAYGYLFRQSLKH